MEIMLQKKNNNNNNNEQLIIYFHSLSYLDAHFFSEFIYLNVFLTNRASYVF